MPRLSSPAELEVYRKEISSARDPKKPCITLCSGTACHATGSNEVAAAIERELKTQGLKGKVDFYEVDVDQSPVEANQFGVRGVPTLVLFHGGEEIDRVVGFRDAASLESHLNSLVGSHLS